MIDRGKEDNPYRSGGSEPQSLATAFAVVFYFEIEPKAVRQYLYKAMIIGG